MAAAVVRLLVVLPPVLEGRWSLLRELFNRFSCPYLIMVLPPVLERRGSVAAGRRSLCPSCACGYFARSAPAVASSTCICVGMPCSCARGAFESFWQLLHHEALVWSLKVPLLTPADLSWSRVSRPSASQRVDLRWLFISGLPSLIAVIMLPDNLDQLRALLY